MRSSIITTVIATLLLVGYIVFFVRILHPGNHPSYIDCSPTSCGDSIIQYPFGTCGLLSAYCVDNQTTQLYKSPLHAQVVGDITNSSYSIGTLQITLNPDYGNPTLMHDWLTAGGFFNVSKGLKITWSISDTCRSCLTTGGRCYSKFHSEFYGYGKNYVNHCICPNNEFHIWNCSDNFDETTRSPEYMAVIFFGELGAFIIVVVSCIVCHRGCCCKRTERDEEQTILQFMDPLDSRPPTVENFLNYYSSQVPTRYSYAQIRTYTNNLAEQLGKGGFGTVYKGKHPSGRLIAVKILDESKQSEQQFIAEVGTVGNTYHVNLVRMLGYCFEGSKRALVYEYMVNGSLEKYIHANHQEQLNWKQLYSIAIGTARGISYLH